MKKKSPKGCPKGFSEALNNSWALRVGGVPQKGHSPAAVREVEAGPLEHGDLGDVCGISGGEERLESGQNKGGGESQSSKGRTKQETRK